MRKATGILLIFGLTIVAACSQQGDNLSIQDTDDPIVVLVFPDQSTEAFANGEMYPVNAGGAVTVTPAGAQGGLHLFGLNGDDYRFTFVNGVVDSGGTVVVDGVLRTLSSDGGDGADIPIVVRFIPDEEDGSFAVEATGTEVVVWVPRIRGSTKTSP